MNQWPDDLFSFAYLRDWNNELKTLADDAEPEDWRYQNTTATHPYPILANYLRYTYKRVTEENKIAVTEDEQFACFNTGLVTPGQEPLFASFKRNRNVGQQPWVLGGWFRKGRSELNIFPELPDIAHYFDDPSCLVLDTRKEFRVNIEHIIEDNKERFAEPYRSMSNFQLQNFLNGAVSAAREKVRRNYKSAIPQYYNGKVQLLLPLCLSDPRQADLALVVERHEHFYRASTCLPLDWAYNNARQLARPDRDWLQP
jgi:hypothetical protein